MTDIFGAIKVADDLEQAVIDTLSLWWEVYARELELQSPPAPDPKHLNQDDLPLPRTMVTSEHLDKEAADQFPAIVVVSPGLSGRAPKQEGDGTFRCFFSVAVGVFVQSNTRQNTKRLLRLYTAIARTIILQKQSLDGYASGTTWLDESYDDNFNFTERQTGGAGQVIFEIEVDGVVNRRGGPAVYGGPSPAPDPDHQPGEQWPLVDTATATVEERVL